MKYSHTVAATNDPAACFRAIASVVNAQDKSFNAVVMRNLFAKEFLETIYWRSASESLLVGALGRKWGKYYKDMAVTFSHDGKQITTILSENEWLAKARWPIYIVTAFIPPLWWLFFLNLIFHLPFMYGMPRTVRAVSEQMSKVMREQQ